jgi:hypothetical protein
MRQKSLDGDSMGTSNWIESSLVTAIKVTIILSIVRAISHIPGEIV